MTKSGLLHHVGFTSSFNEAQKKELTEETGTVDRSTRIHRQQAGWPKPMEHEANKRMGAVKNKIGRGSSV